MPELSASGASAGPLAGVRVVEFAGIGPVQFAGMMLADMGADVIRIDRTDAEPLLGLRYDILDRGRRSISLNLKEARGLEVAQRLLARADIMIEGFRPGVMERLGLDPESVLQRNPRLVYGRITGWGQTGPLAGRAGHDINYIAVTGALHAIGGRHGPPSIPLNLVGDFGGGGMLLLVGVLSALHQAKVSGRGQVVDAAMTDGVATLLAMIYSLKADGRWRCARESNLLDGGAPFYSTYVCADGGSVAVGPLEHRFFQKLLTALDIDPERYRDPRDESTWPSLRAEIAAAFKRRTRSEWCALLEGCDVCVAPVLDLEEAPRHPHSVARQTYVEVDGIAQPAPAPRFSGTPSRVGKSPPARGADTRTILKELGYTHSEIARFTTSD